jgi:hypothetical protein
MSCLHINEKNSLFVSANSYKNLWQEEEMNLLNHDKVFHLLEPPPLLSSHEMKQNRKPNLLE